MLRKQNIEVDQLSWTIEREHSFRGQGDGWHEAQSVMFVCPKCLKHWATLRFHGDELIWPRAQTCESCLVNDEWLPVPGSLLEEIGWGVIDTSLLNALPEVLLKREFALHLKAFDHENSGTNLQVPRQLALEDAGQEP